ncbi:hypothetical protein SAMN06297468_1282 [Altererythrobacter xiamenensis]|uniref:UPF0235 protein SAMN06297468_1282 n=1 Tax=Altererythrobacter xiamenensis TaxID=1316679 RepID=A0A1Y6F2K2_9SPHN|nr:DUF167 domain-containing protein [Altererythrobacter xiamenensis]SMQ69027.1 hypothetical protein SAMN06297468_1282 [Altererythrobacter xiamenensis]
MARPRAVLPPQQAIEELIEPDGRLAVRVTPGARSEAMTISDGTLHVKTRAKPQDGAANDAVIKLVAQALSVAPSRVELLRGATSRDKLLQVAR